jgi:hypothetical protein
MLSEFGELIKTATEAVTSCGELLAALKVKFPASTFASVHRASRGCKITCNDARQHLSCRSPFKRFNPVSSGFVAFSKEKMR